MNAKDAISQSLDVSDMIMDKYLEDLDDDAFLTVPVEGMNHIAWQVGHLIQNERSMVEAVKPGSCPPLPEGFEAKHKKDTTTLTDPSKFHTKAEYMAAWKAQRAATRSLLDSLGEADLDAPAPESLRGFAANAGQLINLTGLHPLMHVGQFVAVRRQRKMPVVF